MAKNTFKHILQHPDRDEIISKLIIGISSEDIHEWLKAKYTNVSEIKFVISQKSISSFQDNYLDIYNMIQEDIAKSRAAITNTTEEQLNLAVKNNSSYRNKMIELAGKELDIRQMVANLCVAIESRVAQVFDEIQEDPRNINTRVDRLLIDYAEALGNILEKYYKFTEVPVNPTVQHNVTLQVVDQHISVFYDVIKEILANMDVDTSLYFMELFNQHMAKLKMQSAQEIQTTEVRLAEARLLNETINKKLNMSN